MRFPAKEPGADVALADVSLDIEQNTVVSLVGRGDSGKTTLLDLVAGIRRPAAGQVLADGAPVREPGPDRGIVFQRAALFPWLPATTNIDTNAGTDGDDHRDSVADEQTNVRVLGSNPLGRCSVS